MIELEDSVSRMEQSMAEADEERFNKEKNVRLLVTEMVQRSSENVSLESIDSEKNASALETFFSMMKVLSQQTSRTRESDTDPSFHDLESTGSIKSMSCHSQLIFQQIGNHSLSKFLMRINSCTVMLRSFMLR